MLTSLSEQTTVEKGAQVTAQATQRLRQRVREESLAAVQLQNELAKLRVDVLTAHGRNAQLREVLAGVDAEIREKGATIEKYQVRGGKQGSEGLMSPRCLCGNVGRVCDWLAHGSHSSHEGS